MATCPECEFDEIDTVAHEEGDELNCPECGKNLVLAGPDVVEIADDDDDDDLDDDDDDEEEKEAEVEDDGLADDEDDVEEEEEE